MELITLQQHDNQWKRIFDKERELILNTLDETVNKIHHVGSTAIPDLLAKPIIDIAVESILFPPSQIVTDLLDSIGYECRGEAGVMGRFWFTKGHPRKFNLHFCMVNSNIVQDQIVFRNKLINNQQFRREYESLKLKHHKDKDIDSSAYAEAKSDFIHKVIASGQI